MTYNPRGIELNEDRIALAPVILRTSHAENSYITLDVDVKQCILDPTAFDN